MYEETGYDIGALAKEDEFIEGVLNYQYTRLYLIRDVPIETVFVPRTRKEIKCCEWFSIEHLPTHKTDPVSRNHLGINANSFFMIMPFVKRLKKWINEQSSQGINNHPVSKKSKAYDSCSSKLMTMAAGVINSNTTPTIQLSERNDAKSPSAVFFKNNAGNRRQRHKSMGDFDSTNVVAHDSTGDTQMSHQQPNGGTDSNGVVAPKSIGGKRKLFTIDQASNKRSASPYASNFQLQPVHTIHANGNVKYVPCNNLMKTIECSGSGCGSGSGSAANNRKKKSAKSHTRSGGAEQNGGADEHADQSENECQSAGGQQKWLFNPPKLSHLLCKEPNIANWSNVRLNKDSIVHASLKSSGKMSYSQ